MISATTELFYRMKDPQSGELPKKAPAKTGISLFVLVGGFILLIMIAGWIMLSMR